MKIIHFDAHFRFGNPNNHWADPSYQLEPGDDGYIPPAPSAKQTNKTKKTKMKRNKFYPLGVAKQLLWLENWRNKIGQYAPALGLTPAQVAATVAEARWLIYVLSSWLPAVRAWAMACTDAAAEAQTGPGAAALTLPTFDPPAPPDQVAPVAPGALLRIFALIETIRLKPGCTEAVAQDLGLTGSEQTGPDLNTIQPPPLKALRSGSVVNLPWTWGGYSDYVDAFEMQVDRNDGKGWVFLNIDTTPGYTDSHPQPATPTVWKYRGIFRVGDQQVGQWTAEVSVAVGG